MGWRDRYKVHPAADVFPMMPDEETDALAEDIKANGLREPITLAMLDPSKKPVAGYGDGTLSPSASDVQILDGRNRLEAVDRAGMPLRTLNPASEDVCYWYGDPVAYTSARTSIAATSPSNSKRT
jgi:hypothetical protein